MDLSTVVNGVSAIRPSIGYNRVNIDFERQAEAQKDAAIEQNVIINKDIGLAERQLEMQAFEDFIKWHQFGVIVVTIILMGICALIWGDNTIMFLPTFLGVPFVAILYIALKRSAFFPWGWPKQKFELQIKWK